MIQELLHSSPGLANFGIFFLLAVLSCFYSYLGFVTYGILAERKVMGFMQLPPWSESGWGKMGAFTNRCRRSKAFNKRRYYSKASGSTIIYISTSYCLCTVLHGAGRHSVYRQVSICGYRCRTALLYCDFGNDTIGIVLGGWASNNKYALLGGMRAAAQMISYEIPLVMSVVGIILLTGSLNLNDIVAAQEKVWFIFLQPIAFIVFFIASIAELNRTPFDLPESENELVAGYHVEYSGFRWAFFMLAEYVYIFAMSALITVLFLGGWYRHCLPGLYPRCRMVCT